MEEIAKPVNEVADLRSDLGNLQAALNKAMEQIKERETSVIRGVGTVIVDLEAWITGKRKDFPKSAVIGLIAAYLTPRILLVIGSIAAGIGAGLQIWLLFRQNDLIEQQGRMLTSQTKSAEFQARIGLLAMMDPEDKFKSAIAFDQVSEHPDIVKDTLWRLAEQSDEAQGLAKMAFETLMKQADAESFEDFVRILGAAAKRLTGSVNSTRSAEKPAEKAQFIMFMAPHSRFVRAILEYVKAGTQRHEKSLRSLESSGNQDGLFNEIRNFHFVMGIYINHYWEDIPFHDDMPDISNDGLAAFERDFLIRRANDAVVQLCATATNIKISIPKEKLRRTIDIHEILGKSFPEIRRCLRELQ